MGWRTGERPHCVDKVERRSAWGAVRRVAIAAALLFVAASSGAQGERETIVFGASADYPPFEWIESGTPKGFYIDLTDAIVERGGAVAEYRLGTWPDTIRALESGAVDTVVMFRSDEREREFLFTQPFYFVSHGVYARVDSPSISSLEDLEGRTIAVEELSFAYQQLLATGFRAELVATPNTVGALEAVAAGRANYALLATATANYLIRDRDLPLHSVGPPLWPSGYAYAVRKDRPELAAWLGGNLNEVLRSGQFNEIVERWEDELDPAGDSRRLGLAFLLTLLALAAVTLMGAAWVSRLRRHVAAQRGQLLDETARRGQAESQVRWAIDHDSYTDLPRLHRFAERVDALLADAAAVDRGNKQVVAIKPADLEKTIRTLGHDAGIAVMRDLIARLLAMEFDAYGQGGRDVLYVFGDKRRINEKLRPLASPRDTLVLDSTPVPQLYAGSATWPDDGTNARDLLRRAETALDVAIQRREGWVEYRSSMEPDETDLRLLKVFRESGGEGLFSVFQPQVDLRSGRTVGAEMLARWNVPEIGIVTPGKFVPLLEEAGLIRHVTRRMIHDAVRVAAGLRKDGFTCPISVNVAVSDLISDKTRRTIFTALREHGGVPGDLQLELTETSFAGSAETVRWVMTRLRDSGLRVSIDDFGTGYSSLSYLSDFPIDEVKLDQSFIRGIASKPQNKGIVRSAVAMGHELGLVVVAEGVETEDEMKVLRNLNCDRAQGFLISQPLPEQEFVRVVQSDTELLGRRHN